MASQFPPKKNAAFTLFFTLYKSDGTVIANPGTITKKVSIDGAAVADISAGVTEEDTTYGQCSVVLSAAEMNGDAIWIYIKDDTSGCVPLTMTIHTVANTLDERAAMLGIVTSGTMQAGSDSTHAVLAAATSFANDLIIGSVLVITGGTGVGQSRVIIDWDSSTDTATVDTFVTTPDATSTYVVLAAPPASTASLTPVTVSAIAANAITAASIATDAGAEIADAVLDEVVEGSHTFRQYLRLFASSLFAKLTGAGTTTVTIRDVDDTKNRIVATVDLKGNRSAVTLTET